MTLDLSFHHRPISNFLRPSGDHTDLFRLTREQLDLFHDQGYLSSVRILNDAQVDALREEVSQLANPTHPGNELFYEYHSNESSDPNTVLFHALGMAHLAWLS